MKQNKIKLEDLPKGNIFRVPEGYFNAFPSTLESKLIMSDSVLSVNIHKVPDGYFKTLSEKINSKLPVQKTEVLKQSIHVVPEGYFDGLPSIIQQRIVQKERKERDTPVVQLIPVVRYSIAAGFIAAVLMVSIVLYNSLFSKEVEMVKKEQIKNQEMASALIAKLNKTDIKDYLENQGNVDVNQLLHYSSLKKKEKIQKEFEKDILDVKLKDEEKKALEVELEDIDMTELYPEI